MLKSLRCLVIVTLCVTQAVIGNKIDCTFETGTDPTRCGYEKDWDGMFRANWKIVEESRDKKIRDPSSGYFAYFEARNRPSDFASRFISPISDFYDDICISFSYVNKGIKSSYPAGRSKLEVYFAPAGRAIRKDDTPLWSSTKRTRRSKWVDVEVPISKDSFGQRLRGAIVFVAVRGGSKRAYIAIDNVSVTSCKGSLSTEVSRAHSGSVISGNGTNAALGFIRTLAAFQGPVRTREFSVPPGMVLDPSNPPTLPTLARPSHRRRGNKKQRGRKRKNRQRNRANKRPKELGVVYFTGEEVETESHEPFVPTLVGQERPQVVCDFIKYTQGLQRCLRAFFSMLRQHRSRNKCNADFHILERCLKTAASKCVPSSEMTTEVVNEIVTDTLRNKFKTQKVYCFEEGAFVFPEFSLGSIPLQCTPEYFGKLTTCGGSFAGLFNFKHGEPGLCREYFQANECQRRTTAEECSFDTRSMLVYGLNLQYQFAHNPFCIDLPFSAWWPDE